MTESEKQLICDAAKEAANMSYSPYSRFRVGAAVLCGDGSIVKGTNVENRSYGLTNCAERTAIFTAIAQGKGDFKGLALFCPDADTLVPPCGACRQVISEFVKGDFPVFFACKNGNFVKKTIQELYPMDSLHDLK